MKARLIVVGAVGLLVAGGCTIPRAALVAGTIGAITGAVVLSDRRDVPDCSPIPIPYGCLGSVVTETSNLAVTALGATILAVSGGILLSGVIGLAQEPDDKPADPRLSLTAVASPAPRGSIPPEARAPAAAATAGASATTALSLPSPQLQARLAVDIRLAARANRCPSAQVLLRALARMDPAFSLALIDGDEHVRRCAEAPALQAPP
jgi:hypothetical protein